MTVYLLVCFIIIAVACGRLTGTVSTTELAHKSDNNETNSFPLQYGSNDCIVPKWRNKQSIFYSKTLVGDYKYVIDTRESEMTVNIAEFNKVAQDYTDNRYIGFVNCGGAFPYDCPSNLNKCSWYVPIINGGICNSETGERFSGKIDFQYRYVCPIVGTLLDFKINGCFWELGLCF